METNYRELVALSDTDQAIISAAEDIRGRDVKDAAGEDLGRVDELLIDRGESKVRFMVLASGGFLGLGEQKSYLPVDVITGISDDEVRVDQARERIAGSPAYDPELVNEPDYHEKVASYWGYMPFWSQGYGYPSYPYYR